MQEYDEYESLIKKISEYAIANNISSDIDYLSKIYRNANGEIKKEIEKAVELRNELGFLDEEVAGLHAVLAAGSQLYSNFENIDVAFCVSYDVCCCVNRNNLIKECEKYQDDAIFSAYPRLKNLVSDNQELIDISGINNSESSRILRTDNMIIKISDRINPKLVHYLKSKYPNNKLFVRIDKENYGKNTSEFVCEAVMRSEQSHWYKEMRIYNGEDKAGEYTYPESIIDLGFPKAEADSIINRMFENGFDEEKNKYILQTFFKRDNSGILSGSIEELQTLQSDNTFVSKHIHLTSDSEVGTKWEEGNLAHIDGAINVYFDDNAKDRLSKNLKEKVPANCRTHLFRIDNIPITELLPIAKLFFKGLALVEAWENDSFTS